MEWRLFVLFQVQQVHINLFFPCTLIDALYHL